MYQRFCFFALMLMEIFFKNPLPAFAQSDSCGNGQPWQLEIGMIAEVNPNTSSSSNESNLRKVPGGDIDATVRVGELFRVIDGPECTSSNGISWWFIVTDDGREGWVSQGKDDEYWIIPFEVPDDLYVSNFNNSIELDEGTPIVSATQQLSFFGGYGGGCIPPELPQSEYVYAPALENASYQQVEATDYQNFKVGENVEITVYKPDGEVYLQRTEFGGEAFDECGWDGGEVGIYWSFNLDDPAGIWIIEFKGEFGKNVSYQLFLHPSSFPNTQTFCPEDDAIFVLLQGFNPNESISLRLLEDIGEPIEGTIFGEQIQNTTVLNEWDVRVDEQGQLIILLPETIEPDWHKWIQTYTHKNEPISINYFCFS
jgi:hypothetical protein